MLIDAAAVLSNVQEQLLETIETETAVKISQGAAICRGRAKPNGVSGKRQFNLHFAQPQTFLSK